ncbi:hypothetical protein ABPG74_003585 [Tetrahymena malaccensis]
MRLIGRVCGVKNPKAFQIHIDETEDINSLKRIFEEKTGIPIQYQILTTIVEGQYIKVIEGWTLEFYQFYDNQLINVYDFRKGEYHFNHPSCQKKVVQDQLVKINAHYYRKLGLIGQSEEIEKIQSLDNSQLNVCSDSNILSTTLDNSIISTKATTPHSYSESEDGYPQQKFYQILQQFIKAIQDRKWKEAKQYLDLHTTLLKKYKKIKQQDLISELDSNGWNSLHYASYLEFDDICRKLIIEGADVNKPTQDDWTPLQLAVFKNNLKVVKVLTDSDDLIIDQLTQRGTALHLASAKGFIKIVQYLVLDKNANPELKHPTEAKSPFDVATKKVRFFFRQHRQIKKFDIQTAMDYLENRKSFFNDMPKKPPMIRGYVFRQHDIFPCICQKRFLEINSDTCTLQMYKEEDDVPLRPQLVISLTDILDVDLLPRHWPMQKDFIYVRIIFQNSMVIAFKTKEAAEHWIDKLNEAIAYANYVDKKLRSFLREKEIADQQSTDKLFTMFSTIQINQQVITIKDEQHFCAKCDEKDQNNSLNMQQSLSNIENGMNFQEILAKHVKKSFHIEISHSLAFKDFTILGALGKGSFGRVFLVQQNSTEELFAMKMLKKVSLIMKRQLKYAVTECNILKRCKNPFVVGLHYAFQTPNHLYMVLDYCNGGVLLQHIQRESRFSELTARFFVCEIILAIEYLHQQNILYRDLKPENILISSDGHIKLTDFGLSKEHVADFDVTKSFCGSPAYLSPEMLLGKGFSKASDIYGIGCVLYEMLTGQPPFFHEDIKQLYSGIKSEEPQLPKYLSNPAKSLITQLLKKNPKERLGYNSIQQIKSHEFFEGIDWHRVYEKKYQPPQFLFANQHIVNTENKEKLQQRYMDQDYNKQNQKINRVKNWSFIGKV